MEKHKCKLCWKSFVNGRALGGHMRSHMVNLPIPPKNPDEEHPGRSQSASSSSSSSDDEPNNEGEKEIPMADPQYFSSSVLLQDRESETESSKNPTRKRSRLSRKPGYISLRQPRSNQTKEEVEEERRKRRAGPSQLTETLTEPEPVSSVSDAATTEEDVAFCLMMLSRDRWGKKQVENNEGEEAEEESECEGWKKKKQKKKVYYKCETCDKAFKSYQALGGHRASHKKKRVEVEEQDTVSCRIEKKKEKIHECGICLRVFSSGQALGGHKRSHAAGSMTPFKVSLTKQSLIDLNLPPPVDDDENDDDDLISAVSDA